MNQETSFPAVEIRDLQKFYGDYHALRSINLTVEKGERIVICGPSGSRKSTMIRCLMNPLIFARLNFAAPVWRKGSLTKRFAAGDDEGGCAAGGIH